MSTIELAGSVAVITGAGRGIGEGIARTAVARGMKVVLADINGDPVEAVAADLRAQGGEAIAVKTDVSDPASLENLADRAYEAFGEVNLLVNNAGIEMLGFSWEVPAETWEKTLAVNIMGVVHGARTFASRMIESGKVGWIANVASIGALCAMPIQTSYIMSKHAVLSFSECLALELELAEAQIGVTCIFPGAVETDIFKEAVFGGETAYMERHRNAMRELLSSHGLSPLEAGKIILDGIARGDFWVTTDPEAADSMAQARADYLVNVRRPQLLENMQALL